jgi:hypothetical protein
MKMNSMTYLALVLVFAVSSLFITTSDHASSAQQQQTSITTRTNFTKLLSQKEFKVCRTSGCFQAVKVVYQSPIMLVLDSTDIDVIWKAVEVAKKEGYKIDGISTYIPTNQLEPTVNVLVAMSKG